MPMYEFEDSKGRRHEVFGRMASPPPERLVLDPDSKQGWRPARDGDPPDAVLSRVWSKVAGKVNEYEINWRDGGLPVSHAAAPIPGGVRDTIGGHEVRRHAGGLLTDKYGQPIIRNRADQMNANAAARARGINQVWD